MNFRRTEKRRLYARNALWKFLTGAIFKNKFLTIQNGPKKDGGLQGVQGYVQVDILRTC